MLEDDTGEEKELREAFIQSLAVAGRSGTLAGRMRGSAAAGRCAAKTGTLNGVSALSGYCFRANGEATVFSILNNRVNTDRARSAQDRMAALIARYTPYGAQDLLALALALGPQAAFGPRVAAVGHRLLALAGAAGDLGVPEAVTGQQHVVLGAAEHLSRPFCPNSASRPLSPLRMSLPVEADQPVRAVAPEEHVVARPAGHRVTALLAAQHIVGEPTAQHVGADLTA